jgi:DNA-binding MarR family transcriptional regulator
LGYDSSVIAYAPDLGASCTYSTRANGQFDTQLGSQNGTRNATHAVFITQQTLLHERASINHIIHIYLINQPLLTVNEMNMETNPEPNVAQIELAPNASLEFCLRLTRAYATLTRRLDNALSSVHGLSFGDFMILYYLGRAPGKRLRRVDLAERLGLTASGVTRSLLPLEKLGLVERQPDPRDARVGYALLSDAGQQLLDYALVSVQAIAQEATQNLSADQLEAQSALLGQLAGIHLGNS